MSTDSLILRAGFDVVISRCDAVGLRVRWPRPWQALPLAPLLSARTVDDPARWRNLFWGPAFARRDALRDALRDHSWPVTG